jgi:hypothetical protein
MAAQDLSLLWIPLSLPLEPFPSAMRRAGGCRVDG